MTRRHCSKELHNAMNEKSLDKMKYLIKAADINTVDDKGRTVLHLAVIQNDLSTVKFLLNEGADINRVTRDNSTLLHIAVIRNNQCDHSDRNSNLIKFLLKQNININAKNYAGESVLHIATKNNDEPLIKLLLDNNANINEVTNSGLTVLHYAITNCVESNKSILVIESFLKFGAEINFKNKRGETPLHLAVKKSNFTLTEYLLSKGANINCQTKNQLTPLCFAIKNCNIKITKLLLQNGATIDTKNTFQENLLHLALKIKTKGRKRLNLIKLLLKNGISLNDQDYKKSTALHLALQDSDEELVQLLIEHGSSVNLKDDRDFPPLYFAISYRLEDSVKLLLSKGANVNDIVNVVPRQVESLLSCAVTTGNKSLVQMLLEYNVEINSTAEKISPLNTSIIYGFNNITTLLLEKGANVNLQDSIGNTPLHLAVKFLTHGRENKYIIEQLLDLGADVTLKNDDEQTPLMEAENGSIVSYICNSAAFMLIRHMAFLGVRNNQTLDCNDISVIFSKEQYIAFFVHCLDEISQMKKAKIDNDITYKDLLIKEDNYLAKYVQNKNVIAAMKLGLYKQEYPKYCNYLYKNFLKGQERNQLINRSRLSFISIISFHLPIEIATMICEILPNIDLINLEKSSSEVYTHTRVQPFTMTLKRRKNFRYKFLCT